MSRGMKWVVGSIAVLIAFVVGVAVGWTLRARQPTEVARPAITAAAPAPPPPTPPTPVASASAAPRWTEDTETFAWPLVASDDVVAVDATHYLVRRSFLERQLAENRFNEARIVPAYADGGVTGVRIFGVRPSSSLARFGLKNGDTLETINGVSLASPDKALEAYTHVREGTSFVLALERNGAHVDLHYRVVR